METALNVMVLLFVKVMPRKYQGVEVETQYCKYFLSTRKSKHPYTPNVRIIVSDILISSSGELRDVHHFLKIFASVVFEILKLNPHGNFEFLRVSIYKILEDDNLGVLRKSDLYFSPNSIFPIELIIHNCDNWKSSLNIYAPYQK